MSLLAECPACRRKQAVKNRVCSCGEDLLNAKRSRRVRFWINYRLPGGKQRREPVGFSIEEARDAEGKRRSQKRENRIFDIKPDSRITFRQLSEWYLDLEKVKALAYYPTLKINLNNFLREFGETVIYQLKPADLENYQARRREEGYSDSYIDQEIGAARGMVYKGFDNDLVSGDSLRPFKKVRKLLKRNANARDRILTPVQYESLLKHLPLHSRAIVSMAFYTGMRRGEILNLTWDRVDLKGSRKMGSGLHIDISRYSPREPFVHFGDEVFP